MTYEQKIALANSDAVAPAVSAVLAALSDVMEAMTPLTAEQVEAVAAYLEPNPANWPELTEPEEAATHDAAAVYVRALNAAREAFTARTKAA